MFQIIILSCRRRVSYTEILIKCMQSTFSNIWYYSETWFSHRYLFKIFSGCTYARVHTQTHTCSNERLTITQIFLFFLFVVLMLLDIVINWEAFIARGTFISCLKKSFELFLIWMNEKRDNTRENYWLHFGYEPRKICTHMFDAYHHTFFFCNR